MVEKVHEATKAIRVSVPGMRKLALFDQFKEGETVDGKAGGMVKAGIYVNIGAERYALLRCRQEDKVRLEPREALIGMRIKKIDLEKNSMEVSFPVNKLVEGRPFPEVKRPIQNLKVGEKIDGVVSKKVQKSGFVYVDIDCETDARILAPFKEAASLEEGELLKGMTIEKTLRRETKRGVQKIVLVSVPGLTRLTLFDELQVGDTMSGIVRTRIERNHPNGHFMDIGAEGLALIKCAPADKWKLYEGERLQDLKVEAVDVQNGHVEVTHPDLDVLLEGREAKEKPLQEFSVGQTVDGTVSEIVKDWVYVDIGCTKPARILTDKADTRLEVGDRIEGMTIKKIQNSRLNAFDGVIIFVSVPGLPQLTLFDDMKVGDIVHGTVRSSSPGGHFQKKASAHGEGCRFVAIGAEKYAVLVGDPKLTSELEFDQPLNDLQIVSINLETNTLKVSRPDLLLDRSLPAPAEQAEHLPPPRDVEEQF